MNLAPETYIQTIDFAYFKSLLASQSNTSFEALALLNDKLKQSRIGLKGRITQLTNKVVDTPLISYNLRFDLIIMLDDIDSQMSYKVSLCNVNADLIDIVKTNSKSAIFYLTDLICTYDAFLNNFQFFNSLDTRLFVQKAHGVGRRAEDIGSSIIEVTRSNVSEFVPVITHDELLELIETESIGGITDILSLPVDSIITQNSKVGLIDKQVKKRACLVAYVGSIKQESNMNVYEMHSLCELSKIKFFSFNAIANKLLVENMVIKLINPNIRFNNYNLDLKIDFSASFNTKNIQVIGVMTNSCREKLESSFAAQMPFTRLVSLLTNEVIRYAVKLKFRLKKVLKVTAIKQSRGLLFKTKFILFDDTYDAFGFLSGDDVVNVLGVKKSYIDWLDGSINTNEEQCLFKDFKYFLEFEKNVKDFNALGDAEFEGVGIPMGKNEKTEDYDSKFQTLMFGEAKNVKQVFLNGCVNSDKESSLLFPRPMLLISQVKSVY